MIRREEPVRFALIGASSMAVHHGHALQRCRGARLVKVHSRDAERARILGARLGVGWTTRLDDILTDSGIDALDIVTEPARHAEVAMRGLRHGKHLLIEKPVDINPAAVEDLMELADRSSRCVSVVSRPRFDPVVLEMRGALEAGAIGRPTAATVTVHLKRDLAYYRHGSGWRGVYGNVLLNQAIHWIDALVWLLGPPTAVTAEVTTRRSGLAVYDEANVSVVHRDGARSTLHASTAWPRPERERLRLTGTAGTLDSGGLRIRLRVRIRESALAMRQAAWALRCGRRPSWPRPLDAQLADVVRSIRSGAGPAASLRDGYEALRVVAMCEASRRGGPLPCGAEARPVPQTTVRDQGGWPW